MKSKVGIIALAVVLSAAQATAGALEDAEAALGRGDAAAAMEILRPSAEAGDTAAQSALGMVHLEGRGVVQDFGAAAGWFAKAAADGDAAAQNALGRLYASGLGVAADPVLALRWLEAAAKQGDPAHQFDLAAAYDGGSAGVSDHARAAEWYRRAAAQGHVEAMASLGVLYHRGEGVPRDLRLAIDYYRKAADRGVARAQNNLGLMYARGEGVARDYAASVELFRKAADHGLPQALTNLGVMYHNGFGVPQDEKVAFAYYARAGQFTARAATAADAPLFFDSRLKPPGELETNANAAAAHGGDPVAMFLEGYRMAGDARSRADYATAADWFGKAARKGMPAAMGNLALLYMRGLGVPQDFALGYAWMNLAAAAGLDGAAALRDDIAAGMTPNELEGAQSLVRETARTARAEGAGAASD